MSDITDGTNTGIEPAEFQHKWANPDQKETVTTEEIDQAIAEFKRARDQYDIQAKLKQVACDFVDEQEAKILDLLKRAGKTKYHSDIGTINIVNKYSVKTPKENTAKRLLFDWINDKHGTDVLEGMLSINSATLNSFVNEEKKNNPLEEIPGLDAPTHSEIIRFTPKK